MKHIDNHLAEKHTQEIPSLCSSYEICVKMNVRQQQDENDEMVSSFTLKVRSTLTVCEHCASIM